VATLEYADGSSRDMADEESETVRSTGRAIFKFDGQASPDAYLNYYFPKKATKSAGYLYTPQEVLAFKRFSSLKDAREDRFEVKYLDLSHNNLKELPAEVLNLKRLIALDISRNPLTEFPQALLDMPNLQYLWVDSCQLKELKFVWDASKKSNLIFLSAQGNQIED
jgi:hypothetical protein